MSSDFAILRTASADQLHGQWLAYAAASPALVGVCRSSRMESVAGALVFNIDMTDVGEEFVVFKHAHGITVVCMQSSPPKCPIENYHEYLTSYQRLMGIPAPGERSVAGGPGDMGRTPTHEEHAYRCIRTAVEIAHLASIVVHDVPKHERGPGGESGIDPQATLAAWKANPELYTAERMSASSCSVPRLRGQLVAGGMLITPLRALRKEGMGTNQFIGAAVVALASLAARLVRGPVAGLVATIMGGAAKKLSAADLGTVMSVADAWRFLETRSHPRRSAAFAQKLCAVRGTLRHDEAHSSASGGVGPFMLAAPEQVFQEFATAKCLVALGAPREGILSAMREARTPAGYRFGSCIAWADTAGHHVAGWRDGTAKPAEYEPDLVVVNARDGRTLMLDAKFRRDALGLLPASGVKDIQAYMQEYELPIAAIAVPGTGDDAPFESVQGGDYTVLGVALTPDLGDKAMRSLASVLDRSWSLSRDRGVKRQ